MFTILISGCSSSSSIEPVGNGQYTLMESSSISDWDMTDVKRRAIGKVKAFCSYEDKDLKIVTANASTDGWSGYYDVTFTCE